PRAPSARRPGGTSRAPRPAHRSSSCLLLFALLGMAEEPAMTRVAAQVLAQVPAKPLRVPLGQGHELHTDPRGQAARDARLPRRVPPGHPAARVQRDLVAGEEEPDLDL